MGAFHVVRKQLSRMRFPWRSGFSLLQRLPGTNVDYEKIIGDGSKSDIVMACVGWLMRVFPEPPLTMARRNADGDLEPIADHPMLDLLESPNPIYDGDTLLSATIMSYTIDGNAYWVVIRNGAGRPVELWWVPHTMIEPKSPHDGNDLISHYEYRPRGMPIDLPIKNVVHFRSALDPEDMRKGISPLKTVMRELFTDAEAANWTASLLRNGGVPGVVVSPVQGAKRDPSAGENLKTVRKYLDDRTSGDNRGSLLTVDGPVSVQQFGFNPQQMNLRDIRRLPEERSCAALGVSPLILHLGAGLDSSTYTNLPVAERQTYRSTLVPTWSRFARTIRAQLLSQFEREIKSFQVQYDTSAIEALQEDRSALSDRILKQLTNGAITLAECREKLGYDTGEGDQYDVFTRPINLIEIPSSVVGKIPSRLGLAVGEDDDEAPVQQDEPEEEPLPEAAGAARAGRRATKQLTEAQRALVTALQRDRVRLQEITATEVAAALESLGQRLEDAWRSLRSRDLDTRERKQDPVDDELITLLLLSPRVRSWSVDVMSPTFERHSLRTANATMGTINATLGLGVNIPDPVMRQLIIDGGTRLGLVDIDEAARRSIFQALHDGRAAGEGPATLGRRIRDYVPRGRFHQVGTRAELIARTETAWAQTRSAVASYRSSGVFDGVVAVDAQGGDTDAICEARNGQFFTFDEADIEASIEHPNGTFLVVPNLPTLIL